MNENTHFMRSLFRLKSLSQRGKGKKLVHRYFHLHTNIDDIITGCHLVSIARLAMQTSYFHTAHVAALNAISDGWLVYNK